MALSVSNTVVTGARPRGRRGRRELPRARGGALKEMQRPRSSSLLNAGKGMPGRGNSLCEVGEGTCKSMFLGGQMPSAHKVGVLGWVGRGAGARATDPPPKIVGLTLRMRKAEGLPRHLKEQAFDCSKNSCGCCSDPGRGTGRSRGPQEDLLPLPGAPPGDSMGGTPGPLGPAPSFGTHFPIKAPCGPDPSCPPRMEAASLHRTRM